MSIETEAATGDVEIEEKSIDDTLRETLAAMREKGMEPHADIGDNAHEKSATGLRDESGRFAKAGEPEPQNDAGEPEPLTIDAELEAAPNTWKREAASTWAALPPEARREIQRREGDFHKGIEQYKEAAKFSQDFGRAIQPFEATLRTAGVQPIQAVEALLASDHVLRYGTPAQKAAKFAAMASHYGIDTGTMASPENQTPVDPNFSNLNQRVDQLTSYLQQQNVSHQKAEEHALNSEIARFSSDPANAHFESVKGHMAALLQAGLAEDLKSAYEQAVYANPQTRTAVQRQQEQVDREEKARKVAIAKQASSVNVRTRTAVQAGIPENQTMEETMRGVLERHRQSA